MHPTIARILGPTLLICGGVSAFLLRVLPPETHYHWLVPGALLLAGCAICISTRNWFWGLGGLASTCGLILILNQVIWPPAGNGASLNEVRNQAVLKNVPLLVPELFRKGRFAAPRTLQAQPSLQISVFASDLSKPRMIAFSPQGDLYVSIPREGRIVVLPDRNRDGTGDTAHIFADNLDQPHGLAFSGNDLIVAENGRLLKLTDDDHDLKVDRTAIVSTDLPPGGGHWTRSVVIGADGTYYVSAGSSCNVCEEDDPRRAAVLRIDKDGGPAEIFSRGLRNSVGLALHPQTGELWASDNGRDMLGDDLPPEEINRVVADGDYGWPYCYGQKIPDPDLGSSGRCLDTLPPEVEMQAHSAPLGITFGEELKFPERLRSMLFVAFHGSWNRSVPTGYKLIGIPFENGQPSGPPEDIVRGWLQGRATWGRPVDPAVGPDGALYLSDDRAGVIYRITAK